MRAASNVNTLDTLRRVGAGRGAAPATPLRGCFTTSSMRSFDSFASPPSLSFSLSLPPDSEDGNATASYAALVSGGCEGEARAAPTRGVACLEAAAGRFDADSRLVDLGCDAADARLETEEAATAAAAEAPAPVRCCTTEAPAREKVPPLDDRPALVAAVAALELEAALDDEAEAGAGGMAAAALCSARHASFAGRATQLTLTLTPVVNCTSWCE